MFDKIAANGQPADANATTHAAVIDQRTSLMWTAGELGELTYADAEARIAALNAERFLGFDDWRLPTIPELFGLVDHSRTSPAIDTDAFPGAESDWYWSSTTCAWSSGCAWVVGFDDGYVNSNHRASGAFVRAVRRVSPAGQ
ncbi:MAG TPA: DUF1566 domain-containing protein [Frateuria sp.]|uniref:Lcl C-terminal domain-containing protein n=1 Tax=Frateuria sp. TaxID=2211372 RepID=UPI002D8006D4|nr:DUF1566 domain-containing protein [Frateuria sp.]HET6807222.1 DUF1566 domain-containing protein [Frateuria sp.]